MGMDWISGELLQVKHIRNVNDSAIDSQELLLYRGKPIKSASSSILTVR